MHLNRDLFSILTLVFVFGWLLAAPDQARAQCTEPTPLTEIGKELDAARQAYFLAEFWQALDKLKGLEERLGCLTAVIPPEDLRAIYSLKGTVHINVEQTEEARRALNRAAAVSPAMDWDQELGNRGKMLFLDLKAAQLTREPGPLLLSWRGADGFEVAVDGKPQPTGKTLEGLYPGEHFLQYRKAGGQWAGSWVAFPDAPPWVPAITEQGQLVVQRAATTKAGPIGSRVKWKPGLYIAGGTAAVALGAGAFSLVSSSQADAVLSSLSADEALPDSYDTYATRANVSAYVAAGAAGAALISTGLAFFLPVSDKPTAQLHVAPMAGREARGVTLAIGWQW